LSHFDEFSRRTSEKSSDINSHENPSSGSRVVSCGQRQTDGQPDRRNEANSHIRDFTNAPQITETTLKYKKLNANFYVLQ